MEEEENVQKLSIYKEEVHPLERIFSEQEIEQSYEFNLNEDQFFLETRRIENKYGLSAKLNEKIESNEILTTAKNKSPPFRRRRKINQQQDDKELLETLFDQTASFVQKNRSRKSVVLIKKIENAKVRQDPDFLKSKKSLSKSNFKQSQSEFLSRIQIFLNRKKNHLQEKILEENKTHNPLLTYKGYMSKSKSIDELAYGNFQKKQEFMEKMKNEIIKKELSQLKQPQINRNIEISSKLGLDLPTKEYIKNLEIKNLTKQEKIQNSKEKKILEELQNCSYKPETIALNKNIIRKKIVDKKQYNDNLSNSYIKINGKNKENYNRIQNSDFPKPKTQKYQKIFEESKIKEPSDKKCENEKKLTVFEESILKIKEEIRSLL